MLYIYKNGSGYIYKRRVPKTNKIFSFNIGARSLKKAQKISCIFNKISYNFFYNLKIGTEMGLNWTEIQTILGKYKRQAIVEGSKYEKTRNEHFGEIFKIEEVEPLTGETIRLDSSHPKVIEEVLSSLKRLSLSRSSKSLEKVARDIVSRSTLELKDLYSRIRNEEDKEEFLTFLTFILKTESKILKEDLNRAEMRFNPSVNIVSEQINTDNNISSNIEYGLTLDTVLKDYLFNKCNYDEEALKDTSSQCYKVNKVLEILFDYMQDQYNSLELSYLKTEDYIKIHEIIIHTPTKPSTHKGNYYFYQEYKKKNITKSYDRRAISTIRTELRAYKRFVNEYLYEKKKYITLESREEIVTDFEENINYLNKLVDKGIINDKKEIKALKAEMLTCIFSLENDYYRKNFNNLNKGKDGWTVFYLPLILFFTGARLKEIQGALIEDIEFRTNDKNEETVFMYIYNNGVRNIKNKSSKRLVPLHSYLVNNLRFKDFINKQKSQKSENNALFDLDKDISREFGRDKSCIEKHMDKVDIFFNTSYTLHSLRHNYKTDLSFKGLDDKLVMKIMGHSDKTTDAGYLTTTQIERLKGVNEQFDSHNCIDFKPFEEIVNKFI